MTPLLPQCDCSPSGLVCLSCAMARARASIALNTPDAKFRGFVHSVLAKASATHGVSVDRILSKSRLKEVVAARRDASVEFLRAGMSYPRVGKILGRDHSTIHTLVNGTKTSLRDLFSWEAAS